MIHSSSPVIGVATVSKLGGRFYSHQFSWLEEGAPKARGHTLVSARSKLGFTVTVHRTRTERDEIRLSIDGVQL
jgi:hypothetical protein